jgi:hypothetical protein
VFTSIEKDKSICKLNVTQNGRSTICSKANTVFLFTFQSALLYAYLSIFPPKVLTFFKQNTDIQNRSSLQRQWLQTVKQGLPEGELLIFFALPHQYDVGLLNFTDVPLRRAQSNHSFDSRLQPVVLLPCRSTVNSWHKRICILNIIHFLCSFIYTDVFVTNNCTMNLRTFYSLHTLKSVRWYIKSSWV